MGKRKRSRDRDYDDLMRTLKKFASKSKKLRRSSSSQSDDSYKRYYEYDDGDHYNHDEYHHNTDYEGIYDSDVQEIVDPAQVETVEAGDAPPARLDPLEPSAPAEPAAREVVEPAPVPVPSETNTGDQHSNVTAEQGEGEMAATLEPDILELLGEDPSIVKHSGENLHKDIAPRWAHTLTNGLDKNCKLELLKLYAPPENCPNMKAPILNLEVKAALSDINLKKDLYTQSRQNQIASSLAAVGQVLNWALSAKNGVPQNIIKTLSDAGRLLCDSHYRESQSRRFTALNNLNKNIRDTIKDTKINEYLFGPALSEHIKSSKAIIETGSEMKSTVVRAPYKPAGAIQPLRGALNSRGAPPRAPAAALARPPPAPRRPPPPPPRERRPDAAPRGRRSTAYPRHHTRRHY